MSVTATRSGSSPTDRAPGHKSLDDLTIKANEVIERRKVSAQWQEAVYWDEWTAAFQAYYCNRDPEVDENGKPDPTQTSLHMPDTFAYVRRTTARVTAQPPSIKFRAKDHSIRELISRTLMWQWDKARVQRQQKMHVTQALIFGWSVRAWHWTNQTYPRKRRIDPFQFLVDPEITKLIEDTYGNLIQNQFGIRSAEVPPGMQQQYQAEVVQWLISDQSRMSGELLKVIYMHKPYEGPQCSFIMLADCYPSPSFGTLQTAESFIVDRRRDKTWIENTAKWLNSEGRVAEANRLQEVMTLAPKGTPNYDITNVSSYSFRKRMAEAAGRSEMFEDQNATAGERQSATWVITEEHIPAPGGTAKMRLIFDGPTAKSHWIGEFPEPIDIEGKIPFTELVFIDNLLGGIGDSTPRIIRGLQELHSRIACVRTDLAYALARPYVWTTDEEIYENAPEMLRRGKGLRVLLTRDGPNSIGSLNEGPAIASMASTLNDETPIRQQLLQATGENNMSANANLDPAQNRTATGARITAYNQDILSRDLLTMQNFGLEDDATMMYEMTRSEMTEPVEFEASQYNRNYSTEADPMREEWIKVGPELFQTDGEIVVESGSTLADDDEAKQQQVMTLNQMFRGVANVNQDTLRDKTLIAMGQGRNLAEWVPKPMPPPPVPPETKSSFSINAKWEELAEPFRAAIMKNANIEVEVPNAAPVPGQPPMPGIPPAGMQPPGSAPAAGPGISGGVPVLPTPPPDPATGAYAAAKGMAPQPQL